MRVAVACSILVSLPAVAIAEPTATVDLATTFVSGPVTPGAWNPHLRVGLAGTAGVALERLDFRAGWGVYRDQVGCDTCGDGLGPGGVGRELLGSTDLTLSAGHRTEVQDLAFRVAADLVLPASRDALACNPMYAAPGVSASVSVPVDATRLKLSARASRPIYQFDSVPVGRCAPALDGTSIDTLSGVVSPSPWGGVRPGMANPNAAGGLAVAWSDPHRLLLAYDRLSTGISLGVDAARRTSAAAVTLRTDTGTVHLDPATSPFVAAFPWSVSAGFAMSDHADLSLSVSDRVPALLADPGGSFRALPGRTAVTLTLSGHL